MALIIGSCLVSGYIVNSHWSNKWLERDLSDSKLREKHVEELRSIEHEWADKFTDINYWYQKQLEKNKSESDKTIADYRAGNLRLRQQLTCTIGVVSNSTSPGQIADGASKCGLQEGDVEFLVRYSERAQGVVIKLQKAQSLLKVIYGHE